MKKSGMSDEKAIKNVGYKIFKGGILSVEALDVFLHSKHLLHALHEVAHVTHGVAAST